MKKIGYIIVCLLLLTGCQDKHYETSFFYMDTIIEIKIAKVNQNKAHEAFTKVEELYQTYQKITDAYNSDSELYQLNHSSKDMIISDQLSALINEGIDWYDKSNGLLNINIGALTHMWHDFRSNERSIPSQEELANLNIDIHNIQMVNNKVSYNANVNIDLGSIAKGYVTEMAGNLLEEIGINYYLINAGGNVKVGKSSKGYYTIGIASPIGKEYIDIIKGEDISVVTSGGYERFYEYNGVTYHHIIDPNTRYPANHMKSVTVIGKDSGICDALSTILFLMPIEDGQAFIQDYDVDVIWFSNDNQIITNEGFKYE